MLVVEELIERAGRSLGPGTQEKSQARYKQNPSSSGVILHTQSLLLLLLRDDFAALRGGNKYALNMEGN